MTNILVTLPPGLYKLIVFPNADARLRSLGTVTFNSLERNWTAAELAQMIGDYDVLVTGWGTPKISGPVLENATRLKLIAHTGGTVKFFTPPELYDRGILVTNAAAAMALAVAEASIMLILMSLRRVMIYDRAMKAGTPWEDIRSQRTPRGIDLAGARIGVVGAGLTGRETIRLLNALGAEVWLYDPYIDAEQAAALQVRPVDLHTLMASCVVITLQAPSTEETHHMIGAAELAAMTDGAALVNTARSWLTDEAALLAELRTGRIFAALDVFDQEPLPVDHPFRSLENVILVPHMGAHTFGTHRMMGAMAVDEIARWRNGEPPLHPVTKAMLATMA